MPGSFVRLRRRADRVWLCGLSDRRSSQVIPLAFMGNDFMSAPRATNAIGPRTPGWFPTQIPVLPRYGPSRQRAGEPTRSLKPLSRFDG